MDEMFMPRTAIIEQNDMLGGAVYPYLERIPHWFIESLEVGGDADDDSPNEAAMLRWINGSSIVSVHAIDYTLDKFLTQSKIRLNLHKGGFVLSKRMSRVFRPYFIRGYFPAETVKIVYRDDFDKKTYDGAGIISRKMLLRLIPQLPDMKPSKKRRLIHELKSTKRVEFTILAAEGQSKGHAIVSDTLDADFHLPHDIKKEMSVHDGFTFVGIQLPHAAEDMRLDIQSLINLYPFFDVPALLDWLKAEGDMFAQSVESGEIADLMGKLTSDIELRDELWHVAEYLYSGGHPMWFHSIAKAILNQHIRRTEMSTLNKMRLPVPGGRAYVMCDTVGIEAGIITEPVERGHIRVDLAAQTAWVNSKDWAEYLAATWGGADQDDALWLVGFTDYDGQKNMLAWRSPNQPGEYVLLRPDEHSDEFTFPTPSGTVKWPELDSRKLPRITTPEYLGLVDESTAGGLGEGHEYSIEIMQLTTDRAIANRGALGMYCNQLMLAQAVFGSIPNPAPAPLEDVIDGSVKLGTDLSGVKDWCFGYSKWLLEKGVAIPEILVNRLSLPQEAAEEVTPAITSDHWLDRLVSGIHDHIKAFGELRDEICSRTCPPVRVFQAALEADQAPNGTVLRRMYARMVTEAARQQKQPDFEEIRLKTVEFLSQFPPEQQHGIILAAIADAYANRASDAVVWQVDATVKLTLEALREINVLDHLMDTMYGIQAVPHPVEYAPVGKSIQLNGVWFNMLKSTTNIQADSMGSIPKETRDDYKARTAKINWTGARITVRTQDDRIVAYTGRGNLLGYVANDTPITEGEYIIRYTCATDGNLMAIVA